MTWICGMPKCRAVRAGLSEVIVDGAKWVAMEGRIRELEAALKQIHNMSDATQRIRTLAYDAVKMATSETTVEAREPKTPDDWEYWPEKPMHSMSVHHRGRIVDDIWRCWDCPATHGVEYTSDRASKP